MPHVLQERPHKCQLEFCLLSRTVKSKRDIQVLNPSLDSGQMYLIKKTHPGKLKLFPLLAKPQYLATKLLVALLCILQENMLDFSNTDWGSPNPAYKHSKTDDVIWKVWGLVQHIFKCAWKFSVYSLIFWRVLKDSDYFTNTLSVFMILFTSQKRERFSSSYFLQW